MRLGLIVRVNISPPKITSVHSSGKQAVRVIFAVITLKFLFRDTLFS